MMNVGRLVEFIEEIIKIHNEEVHDESLWELYLHSAFLSESFEQFKSRHVVNPIPHENHNLEATIDESFNILNDFAPEGA